MSKLTDNSSNELDYWREFDDNSPRTEPLTTTNAIDLTSDLSEMGLEEREQRRRALRNMLCTTEARQQQIRRNRLPGLTPGLIVRIKNGTFKGKLGTVKDADYIHSRALLDIDGIREVQWLDFASLGPNLEDEQPPAT